MNKTISIGRLTDDPKISRTANGKVKAEFTLALNRIKDGADFPRFVAWEKRAELIESWVHKGTKLAVIGHIQTGSYENKDGKKVYTTDIICDEIEFCDRKGEAQPEKNEADFISVPEGIDTEIPFS